ncbi:S8 family serine peptidase [Microbacterium sp. bgisy203]|uniref:S8 family serine peptidase n=1 Tax=Microbacterium sp. bgisy203 TaxID=3413799 RepID=UPI003D75E907
MGVKVRRRQIAGMVACTAVVAMFLGAGAASAATQPQQLIAPVRTVEADLPPSSVLQAGAWGGPAVAIIDSGVSLHDDLNVAGQVNCTASGDGQDPNGHGTAVAGQMAAINDDNGIVGIAPGAPIYSIRVFDAKLNGSVSNISCALQWVLDNHARYDIKVVNMSMQYEQADDGNCGISNNDVVHQKICAIVARGVTVVAAAGNSRTDMAGFAPGTYDEVLSATNFADFDGAPGGRGSPTCSESGMPADDSYNPRSNYAVSAADIAHTVAAPGTCPVTTKKGNRYGLVASGTSLSAAVTSGVVLQCYRVGTCAGKTPAEVIAIIRDQAESAAQLRGKTFAGDPTRPVAGRFYGYGVSTVPTTPTPTPTPTLTPTPTPTPTLTPTPLPTPDTVPPSVSFVNLVDGQKVSGSMVVRVVATDDVGVKGVTLWSGTAKLATMKLSGSEWTATLNSRSFANGVYPIEARATDAAGNTGRSTIVNVTVAN